MNVPPDFWDWGHWLRQFSQKIPGLVIGDEISPYLLRWYVLPRNPYLNVYVHKFLRSDEDRALHDHPWWFLSVILKGAYIEHRERRTTLRKRGSVAIRRPSVLHRVELLPAQPPFPLAKPVWTLLFTGPRVREWGFKCPKGWVPWKEFTDKNGCGEYA